MGLFYIGLSLLVIALVLKIIYNITHGDDFIIIGSISFLIIGMMISGSLGLSILATKVKTPTIKQTNLYTYNSYKARVESIEKRNPKDRYGMESQILFDEINEWNQDYLTHMEYSKNPWIGALFPEEYYEGIDGLIELPN